MNRKKTMSILLIAIFMLSVALPMTLAKKPDYNTITEGEVMYSSGHFLAETVIPTGFDEYGYNYQAHMFKGSYYNSYAGGAGFPVWNGDDEAYLDTTPTAANHWAWPYREVKLKMKWSDLWISNVDRNDDGKLDRGVGPSYTNSAVPGAWLTNHQRGINEDSTTWSYFVKIVYPDADWVKDGTLWRDSEDVEMGSVLWTSFAKIFAVSNDPAYDEHGVLYNPVSPTGFGYYKP